jgi:hypothetical protein
METVQEVIDYLNSEIKTTEKTIDHLRTQSRYDDLLYESAKVRTLRQVLASIV